MSLLVDAGRVRPSQAALVGTSSLGQIGSWRLTRLLCQGRLCRVYQAAPAEGARAAAYALKLLMPPCEEDAVAVSCMRHEATIGRAISHPHLISVLAAHTVAIPYYIVTPWLNGQTLAAELSCGRPLEPATAFWIARQAAEALDALHQAGWVHGDVKPENIFLSAQRHATLLDLGFARRRDEQAFVDRCLLGTPAYMAPETFDNHRTDIRSDLYSLGVTLFEMLTGQLPFAGRTVVEVIRQHRGVRAESLRRRLPDLPREAALLVAQLLAKEPLRRPQTPRELIDQLVRVEIALLAAA